MHVNLNIDGPQLKLDDIIPMDGVWSKPYYQAEREVIIPRILNLGYEVDGDFFSIEYDDFGPLIRGIYASWGDEEKVCLWYG